MKILLIITLLVFVSCQSYQEISKEKFTLERKINYYKKATNIRSSMNIPNLHDSLLIKCDSLCVHLIKYEGHWSHGTPIFIYFADFNSVYLFKYKFITDSSYSKKTIKQLIFNKRTSLKLSNSQVDSIVNAVYKLNTLFDHSDFWF